MKKRIISLLVTACMLVTATPIYGESLADNAGVYDSFDDVKAETSDVNVNDADAVSVIEGQAVLMVSEDMISAVKELADSMNIELTYSQNPAGDFVVMRAKSDKLSSDEVVDAFNTSGLCMFAEPNYETTLQGTGIDIGSYDDILPGGDPFEPGVLSNQPDEKIIAVLDSGIDYNNPMFDGILWEGPSEYWDVRTVLDESCGYDFINFDNDPMDDFGHGTEVASVLVNPEGENMTSFYKENNIKIMSFKVADSNGKGDSYSVIIAYIEMAYLLEHGKNIIAINNSWAGFDETLSAELKLLIDKCGRKGALSVFAAGNSGTDNDVLVSAPSNYKSPYMLTVAAADDDGLASFSNYGKYSVDVAASGCNVPVTGMKNVYSPKMYLENQDEFSQEYFGFDDCCLQNFPNTSIIGDPSKKTLLYVTQSEGDVVDFAEENGDAVFKWSINSETTGENDLHTLLIPLSATASASDIYSSFRYKVINNDNAEIAVVATNIKVSEAEDMTVLASKMMSGDLFFAIDSSNKGFWNVADKLWSKKTDENETQYLMIVASFKSSGSVDILLDDLGISKDGVSADNFGKATFASGTSYAVPNTTFAAVYYAVTQGIFSASELRNTTIAASKKSSAFEGLVASNAVVNFNNEPNQDCAVFDAKAFWEYQYYITVDGKNLSGSEVFVNSEQVFHEIGNSQIKINADDYVNKNCVIRVIKNGLIFDRTVFVNEKECYDNISYYQLPKDKNLWFSYDGAGAVFSVENDLKHKWGNVNYVGFTFAKKISDVAMRNGKYYEILTTEDGNALYVGEEEYKWEKYLDLPDEMREYQGGISFAFDGDKIYFVGGRKAPGVYSDKVYVYENGEFTELESLPKGRAHAKVLVYKGKLIVTLGTESVYNESVPKNMVYDGTWKTSEEELVSKDIMYALYDDFNEYYYDAKVGVVNDGLVYVGMNVENYGDTFVYDVSNDSFRACGVSLAATDNKEYGYNICTVDSYCYVFVKNGTVTDVDGAVLDSEMFNYYVFDTAVKDDDGQGSGQGDNNGGKDKDKNKLKQIIKIKKPAIANLTCKKKKVTISIKKPKYKVIKYQIVYSKTKKFKKHRTITLRNSRKLTIKRFSKVKKGTVYYFKVRAYAFNGKTKKYSAYSKVKKVKIK